MRRKFVYVDTNRDKLLVISASEAVIDPEEVKKQIKVNIRNNYGIKRM